MKKTQTKKITKKVIRKPAAKTIKLRRGRYIPALVISLFASFLLVQPYAAAIFGQSDGVLAYATNVSVGGLHSATNAQRDANGASALALNGRLNSAAQAKANHMVANNYWSHVAPDGTQPWWFITNAGYQYTSAGENLAYGFNSSVDVVTGWMNSASHRANMLNTTFTEVGFGFANSENYVGKGPQTVVVAMYAKPQAAAPAPAPAPTPAPAQTKPAQTKTTPAPTPATPTPEPTPEPAPETIPAEEEEDVEEPIAVGSTESTPPPTAATTHVSRIQLLTKGSAVWSATFVVLAVFAACGLWLVHKGIHLRRYVLAGERFLAHHHLHLDLTVLSVIYLGFVLLASSGTIK